MGLAGAHNQVVRLGWHGRLGARYGTFVWMAGGSDFYGGV